MDSTEMEDAQAAAAAAEQVISTRGGSVLGKKTILKSDHFPGCQNKRLSPQIDGAPNYRQAGSLRVHGVAMPTMEGIANVLNHIGAQKKGKQTRVLWHSLREEPVIYINGRPFVLRDVERPFSNLEYTGINRERVEQMEFRLKEDILQEASRYGNKILVTDELPSGQMVDQWESVRSDTVKTPLEVYEELQNQGYLVDYERVPITDEKAPKEGDFDNLMNERALSPSFHSDSTTREQKMESVSPAAGDSSDPPPPSEDRPPMESSSSSSAAAALPDPAALPRARDVAAAMEAVERDAAAIADSYVALFASLRLALSNVTSTSAENMECLGDVVGRVQESALEASSKGNKYINSCLRLNEEMRGLESLAMQLKTLRRSVDSLDLAVNQLLRLP